MPLPAVAQVDGDTRFIAGMPVQYVKTALRSFDSFVGALAVDGNAIADTVCMDAVRVPP